jgi:GTP-binding protein
MDQVKTAGSILENSQCDDITPLLDGIIEHVPPPKIAEGPLQMQITSLDYSSFLGRIAVGRVARGKIMEGRKCHC